MKGFFQGSATALITPFDEQGVNYEVLGQLIEFQLKMARTPLSSSVRRENPQRWPLRKNAP